MRNLGVDSLLKKIFVNLADSSYEYQKPQPMGFWFDWQPERISIRWNYKNDPEFYRVDMIMREPEGVNSKFKKFILVSIGPTGNDQTAYYVKREKAIDIVAVMNYMAHKNWGNNYVQRP